jgi:transposase InsO family protein
MPDAAFLVPSKEDCRLQAIMAMFRGQRASDVSVTFQISRSDLYKFWHRALTAVRRALADHRRGPKRPHNRLDLSREERVVAFCQRHPTLSSYRVGQQLGPDTPSPRTIQRVRERHGMARLPKRAPATRSARRLTPKAIQRAEAVIQEKPHLGPERIAWDLQNGEHLTISPATIKRLKRKRHEAMCPPPPPPMWRFYERHHPHSLWHGDFLEKVTLTDLDRTAYQLTLMDDYSRGYVFCDLFLDPDMRTTVRALIAAMRQWRVIPHAVIFDNGAPFKGRLLVAFCHHVGIRLIHAAVNHPQTNGKLERAFRDDMKDFYRQYDAWLLEPLRSDLPAYMSYRNNVRGHRALGGKPAITRLNEHDRVAPQALLDRLERFAWYEVKRKVVDRYGYIQMFGRIAYVERAWKGREITLIETLEGLEAHAEGRCVAVMRDYWKYRKLQSWERRTIPPRLYFRPYERATCPRMAVAYQE